MKRKMLASFLILVSICLAFSKSVLAVCPLCTIAVGAGLGISRVLGIDDAISGVWVGGLIVSSGLWMGDFFSKRKWKIPYPNVLSLLLMYLLVVPYLVWSKIIGITGNTILGMDKILFGIILGSIVFSLSVFTDKFLRKINKGDVFIYYQRVILPVLFLTLSSYLIHLFK